MRGHNPPQKSATQETGLSVNNNNKKLDSAIQEAAKEISDVAAQRKSKSEQIRTADVEKPITNLVKNNIDGASLANNPKTNQKIAKEINRGAADIAKKLNKDAAVNKVAPEQKKDAPEQKSTNKIIKMIKELFTKIKNFVQNKGKTSHADKVKEQRDNTKNIGQAR